MSVNTGEPEKNDQNQSGERAALRFCASSCLFKGTTKEGFLFKELLKGCKKEEIVQGVFFFYFIFFKSGQK